MVASDWERGLLMYGLKSIPWIFRGTDMVMKNRGKEESFRERERERSWSIKKIVWFGEVHPDLGGLLSDLPKRT